MRERERERERERQTDRQTDRQTEREPADTKMLINIYTQEVFFFCVEMATNA